MNIFYKILLQGKNFLFPCVCAVCGCNLLNALEIRYNLCEKCRETLIPINGEKCDKCGKPLISEQKLCMSCRNSSDYSFDRLWVLFPYIGKYRKLLAAYKFKGNLALAKYLSEKIMEVISCEPELKDCVIVPVPPRPGKIKQNGWDQVDYLVKQLVKINKEKIISCCLNRHKSKTQKHLNRTERINNLKDRIYLKKKSPKTVLIIDDVITTGSTLEVCAGVLKKGGAEKVYGLCLFYD